jgi:glutamate-1-semialdehyde 2,1-aminomutase
MPPEAKGGLTRMHRGFARSASLYHEALKYIPGGVNSPVRAFKSVGMNPVFIKKGEGSKIFDEDGNEYIDYVGSWGPLILGHRHPSVIDALERCLKDVGTSFGAPTELETILAAMVIEAVPSVEMLRLVNSGTEATMSALRLARGYTGRKKIVKFEGCYHGHADFLLIKAGSGALTLGVPTSPGVPEETAANTIVADFNNIEKLKEIFNTAGEDIAAVIVEPVAGNMGVVPPAPGFLEGLRSITSRYGSLLVFDEVMTGFRVAYGGAQKLYGVTPDLTCLGKVIGGGLPVGAYGGKREIMEYTAPAGPVYQAGTLSGNPLAVTAGIATLKILKQPGVYNRLEEKSSSLANGLLESASRTGVELCVNRVGSMLSAFFTGNKVTDYATACSSNTEYFSLYFKSMLEKGIYIAPSQFEAAFVSTAHSENDIERTLESAGKSLKTF